jgi:hypothetical protein
MPEKTKTYNRVVFTPDAIKQADNVFFSALAKKDRKPIFQSLRVQLSATEEWRHDTEDEFFADYQKGFEGALFEKLYIHGKIQFQIYPDESEVTVSLPHRADVEKVFNSLESNVEKCRLPKQPKGKSKIKTDWITETVNKVDGHCPLAGRKLKLALLKLESEEAEEWQNATMLVRDAWIELTQWLCQVNNIDTSDVPPDAVVDRLRKLKIDKTDERLFNLARASFNLYTKHHERAIDRDTATACVISTIVSMQTVIREVFSASS